MFNNGANLRYNFYAHKFFSIKVSLNVHIPSTTRVNTGKKKFQIWWNVCDSADSLGLYPFSLSVQRVVFTLSMGEGGEGRTEREGLPGRRETGKGGTTPTTPRPGQGRRRVTKNLKHLQKFFQNNTPPFKKNQFPERRAACVTYNNPQPPDI